MVANFAHFAAALLLTQSKTRLARINRKRNMTTNPRERPWRNVPRTIMRCRRCGTETALSAATAEPIGEG
jgi:hypothetical protein